MAKFGRHRSNFDQIWPTSVELGPNLANFGAKTSPRQRPAARRRHISALLCCRVGLRSRTLRTHRLCVVAGLQRAMAERERPKPTPERAAAITATVRREAPLPRRPPRVAPIASPPRLTRPHARATGRLEPKWLERRVLWATRGQHKLSVHVTHRAPKSPVLPPSLTTQLTTSPVAGFYPAPEV